MISLKVFLNYIVFIVGSRGGSRILRKGAHLKKMRRAEGGAKNFGVFRVKNHDFTPKNHIFSKFRGARAGCAPPPLDPPLGSLPGRYDIGIC
jgi:hypothetical protein